MSNVIHRARSVAVLCLLLSSLAAAAQERTYAILSLLGDRFMVAGPNAVVRHDREEQWVALPNRRLDARALAAAQEAIRAADPKARTVLLLPRAPELFALQDVILDGAGDMKDLLAALRPVVADKGATHLILLAKKRDKALLGMLDYYADSPAVLEGLGFYVNRSSHMIAPDQHIQSQGYLALFAYFRVILVDVAGWKILSELPVTDSTVHVNRDKDPWDSLTGEQKVEIMQRLMTKDVAEAIPKAIAESR